jgi:crotonobetaine/carnitine-CoA ligase
MDTPDAAAQADSPPTYLLTRSRESMTIVALLEGAASARPDDVYFTHRDGTFTASEFNRLANQVAAGLRSIGIGAGSAVAVVMDPSAEYYAVWFALAKLGAVEVAINPAYRDELLRHQLELGAATGLVVDATYAAGVAKVVRDLAEPLVTVVKGSSGVGAPGFPGQVHDFDSLLVGAADENPSPRPAPESDAGVVFTSGTTGPSKGVLLSHRYLTAYGLMYAEVNHLRSDDVLLNFQPVFHMTAKFVAIATLAVGGRMHLMEQFSVTNFWDEVRKYGVTNIVAIGGVCNMLLSRPAAPRDADNPLRTCYAVPDVAEFHEEFERRFGCTITTVFGTSEVGLPIFRAPGARYIPGSAGTVSPYYEVQIVDGFDQELPPGVSGEIVVRPKLPFLVCAGYTGQPEKTVQAWRNLWFHTGDRGRVDEHGNCFFEDRLTDSLRRRGDNISSFELESQVSRHPAIAEAVAVSVAAEIGEDEVWLQVRPREGATISPEEVLQHCAEVLPYFMIPRYFDIVDDFPRTATSKVEKYKIRAGGLAPTTWDREAHGWFVRHRRLIPPATGAQP